MPLTTTINKNQDQELSDCHFEFPQGHTSPSCFYAHSYVQMQITEFCTVFNKTH